MTLFPPLVIGRFCRANGQACGALRRTEDDAGVGVDVEVRARGAGSLAIVTVPASIVSVDAPM